MRNTIEHVIKSAALALNQFENFEACEQAAQYICDHDGPLILSGVGKSGQIAQKLASTFRSLGKEAHFVHAADASHGDLGCFVKNAIVMLITHSGETAELSDIVNFCHQRGNALIAITASQDSTIGKSARIVIAYGLVEEADPNGLAPTTSSTLALVIGDAIAVGYAKASHFKREDFAQFHPRGSLGARLRHVREVMRVGENMPTLHADSDMKSVVFELSQKSLGIVILMDNDEVRGIITDGDLRRNLENLWSLTPLIIATKTPKTIAGDTLVEDAIAQMASNGVTQLLVVENGKLSGLIHMHDCMKA